MAMYDFFHEIRMIQAVAAIGHGPAYITHISQTEGPTMPYPPGDTDFMTMKSVPGRNLDEIYDNLTDEQLESIRLQLARILEYALPFLLLFRPCEFKEPWPQCLLTLHASFNNRHLRQEGFLLTEQHPSLLQYDERNDKL